jgi:hypothetical protein
MNPHPVQNIDAAADHQDNGKDPVGPEGFHPPGGAPEPSGNAHGGVRVLLLIGHFLIPFSMIYLPL